MDSNSNDCDLLNSLDINALVQALDILSPSIILKSQVLCTSFKQLFERDTADKCWDLLPERHKSSLLSASKPTLRAIPDRTISHQASPLPKTSAEGIVEYFQKAVGPDDTQRVQRLVRVVQGLTEAKQLASTDYEGLWSAKAGIFDQSSTEPKLRRLYNGRSNISKGSAQYEVANRLSLLFVANEVDSFSIIDKSNVPPGRTRKSIAYEQLAKRDGVEAKEVRYDDEKSRNYFEYLKEAGPGSLLEIGTKTTSLWEKHMVKGDALHVYNYRESNLSSLSKRAKELDVVASKAILTGLVGMGWKWDEILLSRTPLITQIAVHLSKHNYSLHMIREECIQSFSVPISRPRDVAQAPPTRTKKRKRNFIQARDEGSTVSLQSDFGADGLVNQNPRGAVLEEGVQASYYQVPRQDASTLLSPPLLLARTIANLDSAENEGYQQNGGPSDMDHHTPISVAQALTNLRQAQSSAPATATPHPSEGATISNSNQSVTQNDDTNHERRGWNDLWGLSLNSNNANFDITTSLDMDFDIMWNYSSDLNPVQSY